MSTLHSFRKKVSNSSLKFPADMYSNIVGSLIITSYILSEDKPELQDIRKTWNKLKKKGMDYWLDDEDFIDKTVGMFNLKAPYGQMAFVQSELNALFLPYVDIDGEKTIITIREDGFPLMTQRKGKVYPILEKGALNDKQGTEEED